MQHQAPNALLAHFAIETGVAVLVVAGDFVAECLAVHANLVRTPGHQLNLDDAVLPASLL